MSEKKSPVVTEIGRLLSEGLSKSDIFSVIQGWLPGITRGDFNACYKDAVSRK